MGALAPSLKKGNIMKNKTCNFRISERDHKFLRMYCCEKNITMTELFIKWIENLRKKGDEKSI